MITGPYPDLVVKLPCTPGLKALNTTYPKVDGEQCVEVTYIPDTGKERVIETLCPSAPRLASGAKLVDYSHAHDGEGDK